MIDENRTALIHREIDGENSPVESAEFQALAASDPEVHRVHEELLKVHQMLAAVPEADPPADLKPGILRAIRVPEPPRAAAPRPAGSWMDALARIFPSGGRLTLAYGFAAGIVAGFLGFALVRGPGASLDRDTPGLTGTMAPLHSFELVDQQEFTGPGVTGRAESHAGPGEVRIILDLTAEAGHPAPVTVSFDPAILVPVGFQQPLGTVHGITISDNSLQFRPEGHTHYEFRFGTRSPSPSEVHLTIGSGGAQLEKSLRTMSIGR